MSEARVGDRVCIGYSDKDHLRPLAGRVGIVIAKKGEEIVLRMLDDSVMNGVVSVVSDDLEEVYSEFNAEDYAEFVASRLKPLKTDSENLLHCAVGCATEAGEHLSTVKKVYFYGKEMDGDVYENIVEELGDMLFYLVGACNTIGVTLAEVAEENRSKLEKRYPSGYSDSHALARADKGGPNAKD
jgi:NTP pyrophosphatase (non-canonical NTP hydrolase)